MSVRPSLTAVNPSAFQRCGPKMPGSNGIDFSYLPDSAKSCKRKYARNALSRELRRNSACPIDHNTPGYSPNHFQLLSITCVTREDLSNSSGADCNNAAKTAAYIRLDGISSARASSATFCNSGIAFGSPRSRYV